MSKLQPIDELERDWAENPRWQSVQRGYTAADVARLRGSLPIEYSLSRHGAETLWERLTNEDYIHALGALTGN
jgi:isocitrate lyase